MTCNVHAVTVTSTGSAYGSRARVKSINYIANGTAGSIVLRDGGSGGATLLNIATPAVADAYDVFIPDDGILFESSVHITLTNVSSATVFYE